MAGRAELITKIAENMEVTKKQAEAAMDTVMNTLVELVETEGNVTIKGFGRFYIKEHAARTCRNPATGGTVEVPARTSFAFKAVK